MSGAETGAKVTATEFGQNMMKYFLLGTDDNNSDVTFCNHGSYGSTPRCVMDTRFQLLKQVEINPDLWYRSEMPKQVLESSHRLAKFVRASSSDLVYIDNVTTGINIILKVSLKTNCNLPPVDISYNFNVHWVDSSYFDLLFTIYMYISP